MRKKKRKRKHFVWLSFFFTCFFLSFKPTFLLSTWEQKSQLSVCKVWTPIPLLIVGEVEVEPRRNQEEPVGQLSGVRPPRCGSSTQTIRFPNRVLSEAQFVLMKSVEEQPREHTQTQRPPFVKARFKSYWCENGSSWRLCFQGVLSFGFCWAAGRCRRLMGHHGCLFHACSPEKQFHWTPAKAWQDPKTTTQRSLIVFYEMHQRWQKPLVWPEDQGQNSYHGRTNCGHKATAPGGAVRERASLETSRPRREVTPRHTSPSTCVGESVAMRLWSKQQMTVKQLKSEVTFSFF